MVNRVLFHLHFASLRSHLRKTKPKNKHTKKRINHEVYKFTEKESFHIHIISTSLYVLKSFDGNLSISYYDKNALPSELTYRNCKIQVRAVEVTNFFINLDNDSNDFSSTDFIAVELNKVSQKQIQCSPLPSGNFCTNKILFEKYT